MPQKKFYYFSIVFILIFISCSKKDIIIPVAQKSEESPSVSILYNYFSSSDSLKIINENLSSELKNKFVGVSDISLNRIYNYLIINDIIKIFKSNLKRENISVSKNNSVIKSESFEFECISETSQITIYNINYKASDKLYNYIFNSKKSNLDDEQKFRLILNCVITNSIIFDELCKETDIDYKKIVFHNIEEINKNLFIEKDYLKFRRDLFLCTEYYTNTVNLDYFYLNLKSEIEKIYYKNYITDYLENIKNVNIYELSDNIWKIKLYYFYATNNFELFDIYYNEFKQNFPISTNLEDLKILRYDFIKKSQMKLNEDFMMEILFKSKSIELQKEIYIDWLYLILGSSISPSEIEFAKKILSSIENDLKNSAECRFFNYLILQKSRKWNEAIKAYRSFLIDLLLTDNRNKIKVLVEEIIEKQVVRDDYIFTPNIGFDIIETIDGCIINKIFNNSEVKLKDEIVSIGNFRIKDYFDFLIALNSYSIGSKCNLVLNRSGRQINLECFVTDYVQ